MSDDTITAEECEQKVRETLFLVEHAQGVLRQAIAALSVVPGLANEWDHLNKLHDKLKDGWHRVSRNRDGYRGFIQRRDARKKGVAHA